MEDKNTNWYVVMIVLRFELFDENITNLNRRCTIYENLHLIKSSTLEMAYEKAMNLGNEEALYGHEFLDQKNRKGHLIFEGISFFSPINEHIKDGCKLFSKKNYLCIRNAHTMVKNKIDLLSD